MVKNWKFLLILILGVHIILLVFLKFTAWPEMLLWPYLMNHGWLPYMNIAIAHTPLMLFKLAMFYKIFGVGVIQLKIFTWLLILVLDLLIFWIAKRLWSMKVALTAAASFVIWQIFFDGNGLWFDLFMGFFALISYYFVKRKNYLWTGIFWALAFISKQTAVFFLLPIGVEMVQNQKYIVSKLEKFVLGTLIILIPFILVLWVTRILPSFVNWAISFGIFILPKASGQIQLPDFKAFVVTVFPFLIFAPLIWKTGKRNTSLLIWAIAGGLGAYPRFEYFHLQPSLPFLAIASAEFFTKEFWRNSLIKVFMVLYILGTLYLFGGFFMRNFNEGVRFYEQDVQDVVSSIKVNTNSEDKIFVMNWWDNIYALSDRLPAVDPWVPQLSWYMDISGIQEKMISNLILSKPKLIILNPYSESGLSSYVPQKVYNYVIVNYKLKEKIDGIEILIQK